MEKIVNELTNGVIELINTAENKNSIELRFDIGEFITLFYFENKNVLKSNGYDWGNMMKKLSENLKDSNIEGYNTTNLGYMRQFYKKYRNNKDMIANTEKLSWSHNIELLRDRLEEEERIYYLNKAISENWTVKELENQIKDEVFDEFIKNLEKNKYQYNIKTVTIKNYKSLVNIEIVNKSKLLVFAGANATGKSSVFEAIEFLIHSALTQGEIVFDIFEGKERIINFGAQKKKEGKVEIIIELEFSGCKETLKFGIKYDLKKDKLIKGFTHIGQVDKRVTESFSRIFIDNQKRAENKLKIYNKLWLDGSNLSTILKDILANEEKKTEIIEWIQVLIPEIETINVDADLAGKEEIKIYEKAFKGKPITGKLISEGTYNIIALLALFYQTDRPQFVCIEEPETGLNPAILSELVPFFREMNERYNHHIWITTHSTSLVSELEEEELIIVNKKDGETNLYPCKSGDFKEMQPGEAWMSKMLKGGGLPW